MPHALFAFSDSDSSSGTMMVFAVTLAVLVLVELMISGGFICLFDLLLTLPMRRNERARLFLDLLELGLKEGRTPENAILAVAATRDRSLGARFRELAAHLNAGTRFTAALAKVPRLVPPQVRAMLKTGERIGDMARVLPACRQLLNDGVSQVRGALNYAIILLFTVTPFTIVVPILVNVMIIPKFKEVFAGMLTGSPLPLFTSFVLQHSNLLILAQTAILALLWIVMVLYLGGPRLRELLEPVLGGLPDWIGHRLPWRRKRLQRDFSAMLSVLLDSEVPETEAVALAAEATGNAILKRRAAQVCAQLARGVKLTEAVRALDESGELRWRLANALQHGGGFMRALAGWHEALDAKAFQLEQTAAQVVTSALVLFNGFVVAVIVIAVFLPLLHLLGAAVLW